MGDRHGFGRPVNGYQPGAGYGITIASEVMAIFHPANGLALREGLGRIVGLF